MKFPASFKVTPSTQVGDVYATEFEFRSNFPPQFTRFVWDLGDSTKYVYNNSKVFHTYQYPGFYTVSLSAWTDYGDFAVDVADVNVDYVYRDSLTFTQIPSTASIPSAKSIVPFTVSLTSAKINQPLSLVLYAYNSRSVPHYSVPSKWQFIIPKWRFTDLELNTLGEIVPLKTTPIYKNGKVVAVTADYSFYYLDDYPTGTDPENDCPLLLLASLNTEGFSYPPESIIYPYASYSNNEVVQAATTFQIMECIPSHLKVTENFINEIYPIKWSNVSIPVMITLISDSSKLDVYSKIENAPAFKINAYSYPKTNELGKTYVVTLELSSNNTSLIKDVHYKMDEPAHRFQNTDEYGNISTGYIFTSITPLTSFTGDVVVKANTTVRNGVRIIKKYGFDFPMGYPIYNHAYFADSLENIFYRINYSINLADCPFLDYYRGLNILSKGTVAIVPTPPVSEFPETINNYTLPLTGHGNLYAFSFNPVKNRLYTADIDFNVLRCYSAGTALLTSINLQQKFNNAALGPSSISIDGDSNLWVSLFDDRKILKFDYNLNYILSAAPYPEFDLPLQTGSWLEPKNPTFSPPVLETDKNNDVWVCYPSYEMPSRLYKFSSTGTTLLSAALPENAVPISLSIGADNSVWVACKNTNEIIAFDSAGRNLISDGTYSTRLTNNIIRPSYICHDRDGNLCILHGYNLYSYYNLYTNELKTWELDYSKPESRIAQLITPSKKITNKNYDNNLDEMWGGISCDVYNRLWILNSVTNQSIVCSPEDITDLNIIPLQPKPPGAYFTYVIKGGDTAATQLSLTDEQAFSIGIQKSIQAGGDWTGNRWYQKYAEGSYEYAVEGISSPFKVYDLDTSFQLAKVNENWSYKDYFESLALPEVLKSNDNLLNFIGAAVGDDKDIHENLGSNVYEKISNFVMNHSDPATANIDVLRSTANQMSVDMRDYITEYPAEIKRLFNIFSINTHYLRGAPNIESDPLLKTQELLNPFLVDTVMLTADRFYLLKHKQTDSIRLFYAVKIGDLEVYPSNIIQPEGLLSPLSTNYYIYTYKDNMLNETTPWLNNIIDWTSKLTTVPYELSSVEQWYGDEGLLDVAFNNLLTKQLFGK